MKILTSSDSVQKRRTHLITLLSASALTTVMMRQQLTPCPSPRTLADDLAWLRSAFPGRVQIDMQGRSQMWRFIGEAPTVLATPLTHLDEDQVAALIAARGLLRLPDPARPAAEDSGDCIRRCNIRPLNRISWPAVAE